MKPGKNEAAERSLDRRKTRDRQKAASGSEDQSEFGKRNLRHFCSLEGLMNTVKLPEGRTITGLYYNQVELPEVFSDFRKKRSNEKVWLSNNNAPCHRSTIFQEFVAKQKVVLTPADLFFGPRSL